MPQKSHLEPRKVVLGAVVRINHIQRTKLLYAVPNVTSVASSLALVDMPSNKTPDPKEKVRKSRLRSTVMTSDSLLLAQKD